MSQAKKASVAPDPLLTLASDWLAAQMRVNENAGSEGVAGAAVPRASQEESSPQEAQRDNENAGSEGVAGAAVPQASQEESSPQEAHAQSPDDGPDPAEPEQKKRRIDDAK